MTQYQCATYNIQCDDAREKNEMKNNENSLTQIELQAKIKKTVNLMSIPYNSFFYGKMPLLFSIWLSRRAVVDRSLFDIYALACHNPLSN